MEKKSCDVAVIGSGIGGLCAAAKLSYAGYKTIVLEKMPILGGRYTFVDYKGYWVPTGGETIAYGEKDPVLLILKEVGADVNFEMKKILPAAIWRIGGKDHEMPPKGMLWYLISLASRDKQEEERLITALRRCFTWHEPSDSVTAREWLLELTDNKTIHNIFETWCAQIIGINSYEFSAGDLFRSLKSWVATATLVPKNGLKCVIDSLAKVIKDNRGEVLTQVEAQRIVVRNGMAEGVEATGRGGEFQIKAKAVVSNAGPKKSVALAGEDNFDRGYLKEVRELRPTQGLLFILASNGSLYDWPGGLFTTETRRPHLWMDYTLFWPHWAPKGKNWMYVWQQPQSTALYDPVKEYKIFLDDLSETFPRFHEQGGEILLVHNYHSEWPNLGAWPGTDLSQKTSVENLYNVGDAVKPPGWIAGSGAAESGRMVAEDIRSRTKL